VCDGLAGGEFGGLGHDGDGDVVLATGASAGGSEFVHVFKERHVGGEDEVIGLHAGGIFGHEDCREVAVFCSGPDDFRFGVALARVGHFDLVAEGPPTGAAAGLAEVNAYLPAVEAIADGAV